MKFSTMITGAFAALAAAAPATSAPATSSPSANEKRLAINVNQLNGLIFNQVDLNYLLKINSLDLALFQNLGLRNNLNVLLFHDLFQAQNFNIVQLLQLQQLQTVLAIGGTGVFNTFDLSTLKLNILDLGLIQNLGGIELTQHIDQTLLGRIGEVAKGVSTPIILKE